MSRRARPGTGDAHHDATSLTGAGELIDDGGPSCRIDSLHEAAESACVLGEIEVGLDPEGIAVDPATGLVYVSCSRSNAVFVVDLDKLEVVERIPVGTEPIDAVIDLARDHVITADARSDQLSVIDTRSRAVVATVPVGMYPAGLDLDEQGRRVFCGDTMGCTLSVVDLDTLERVATVEAELGAGAVAYDPRHRRIFCVNFVAASVTVIDGDSLEVLARLEVGEGACAVAVNPVRPEVYVVNSLVSTIARFHTGTLEPLGELAVPNAPVGLAAGTAGDRLYTGNRGDGSMSIMGLDGMAWARVPVGAAPGGVTVHPSDPRTLLVANAGSGSITIVRDLFDGPPAARLAELTHPLVGRSIPDFSLPDLHTEQLRHSREWSEKKYILNFFASW